MRLWHYKLIKYLPNSQLKAQWRELNSIFKNQPKHILINYVYKYSKDILYNYSKQVMLEMLKRGFLYNSDNFINYFIHNEKHITPSAYNHSLHFEEHNNRYLLQCFYNLQEKYDRGQKDFSAEQYKKLENFIKSNS